MTTALIGREGTLGLRAKVGVVAAMDMAELAQVMTRGGHDVTQCRDWDTLMADAEHAAFDLVLCDAVCSVAVPDVLDSPVVRVEHVDDLVRTGLLPLLALATELAAKSRRCRELEGVVEGLHSGSAMVGNTPVMRRLQAAVSRAADCDATVLVEGPRGSGKSLSARMIHLKSRRGKQAAIVCECAELQPDDLLASIATGAKTTLILEDVDRLSSNAQAALVKHLKERSTARAPSLVRLITTTSAHIPELVARGAFREDLFYRLHAFPLNVPGLHERTDDIQMLADAILDAGAPATGRGNRGFTPAARVLLESMAWPGNVAQLETVVRRGQVLANGGPIDREHLMAPAAAAAGIVAPAAGAIEASSPDEAELTEDSIRPFEDEEKLVLGRALQATKGNVRRAAQLLGIGRATLYRKIQQYRLRLH